MLVSCGCMPWWVLPLSGRVRGLDETGTSLVPAGNQSGIAVRDVKHDLRVARLAAEPALGRFGKDRATDCEAPADRVRRSDAEAAPQVSLAGLEAEQQHAAAMRVTVADRSRDRLPFVVRRARRQLPPVGTH